MSSTRFTRDDSIRLLTALLAHSLAVLAFLLVNRYGIALYRSLYGPISRGISVGLLIEMLLILFVIVNLVIAVVPNLKVKLGLIVALSVLTGYFLFPHNPIRGYFYCAQTSLLPLVAICLARWLHRACRPQSG
ncbi:hypothetical protein [Pseudomonas sp. MRSN 12121]|uniref:hypothetical protein n=1 Tax=Pseudomonas sp. MRSN 12121 TaxID=1611770 RepID=UPI0005BEBD30|nr:hypothetical protein [Pseudomonas sp. MRSN 12121]AJO76793.1 hypothetical protein TO66_05615 [Pseudomonas sp. MRSN 12121]